MWKFFDSFGAEKVINTPRASLVTALPGSPSDGDEIILTDSLTAPTYAWHFRYVSAKSSNKWVFVGGAPKEAEVTTDESTASTTYTALTTAGPSVAVPVAGDYDVTVSAIIYNTGANHGGGMSYDIGGTGAVDADAAIAEGIASGTKQASSALTRKKSLTAVTLTAKYRMDTGGTAAHFLSRRLAIVPVAIGG